MRDVSTFRLYFLRTTYTIVFLGLAFDIWPLIARAPRGVEHMRGVVWSVLTAVSLLAILGIRYPLRMLPLLMFELVWKIVWLVAVGLPLWSTHQLAGPNAETLRDCLLGVVLATAAMPWGYVARKYIREPGDPWSQPRHPAEQAVSAATS